MSSQVELTIVEALDNLNALAEVDSLDEIEVTNELHFLSHAAQKEGTEEGREFYWIHAGADNQTLNVVKETFRAVHRYLQHSYEKMQESSDTKRIIEGINTIMVLVGEAAKKLESLSKIFRRVTDLKEYKQLQSFYRDRVIRESFKAFTKGEVSDQGVVFDENITLEEELAALLPAKETGVYPLNDLETVINDTDYELFYIKNEDGRNFYTFELARTIKLACDFGKFTDEYFGEDPLLQIKNLQDKALQILAQNMIFVCKKEIHKFFKEAYRYREMELVEKLTKTLMALYLTSYSKNLIRQFSLKGCYLYFVDFQRFLRETINSREFQKFLIYSSSQSQPFFMNLVALVDSLSVALFTAGAKIDEITAVLQKINHRKVKGDQSKEKELHEFFQKRMSTISDILKLHPSGPIFKAVDLVRDEEERVFDPLIQDNYPEPHGQFNLGKKEMILIHMPAPVIQAVINRVEIASEYQEFLRALHHQGKKHLLFNSQNRTSWKEHARCLALEELSSHAEFADSLTVVTIPRDTDFYYQRDAYVDLHDSKEFGRQFLLHLGDETAGFYLSHQLRKKMTPQFLEEVVKMVQFTFFKDKTNLSVTDRQVFIEMTYLLLELKIIELVQPDYLTLTSKDGLDIGATCEVSLFALLGYIEGRDWSDKEKEELERILFAKTLIARERGINQERFHILYYTLKLLNEEKEKLAEKLAPLFEGKTFEIKVDLRR
ncbi:MAG: hypothetical protein KDK55_05860 [Chlamydiia bacterium]|nr:hypothetical protein [Chlamydiia bacterium]